MGNLACKSSNRNKDNKCPLEKLLPADPVFLLPAASALHLGAQLYFKDKECLVNFYRPEKFVNFMFLSCLGASLGVQVWTSLCQNTTLRRVLTRPQAGTALAQLLPRQSFLINTFAFECLSIYLGIHTFDSWKDETLAIGGLLTVSWVFSGLNLTYFHRGTLKNMAKMQEIEQVNNEGVHTLGSLEEDTHSEVSHDYQSAKSNLFMFRSLLEFSTLATLGATVGTVYLISKRINIS